MFNLNELPEEEGFSPLPRGEYPAFVDKLEWKTSKAGAEYLSLGFKVFGENYANRIVFTMFNLFHPKEQVRNIALGQIRTLLVASGFAKDKLNFNTKEDLAKAVLECRCKIKVSVKEDEYGKKNEVKGYSKLEETDNNLTSDDIPF